MDTIFEFRDVSRKALVGTEPESAAMVAKCDDGIAGQTVSLGVTLGAARLRVDTIKAVSSAGVNASPAILGDTFHIRPGQPLDRREFEEVGLFRPGLVHPDKATARSGDPKPPEMVKIQAENRSVGQAVSRRENLETALAIAHQMVPVAAHPDVPQAILGEGGYTAVVRM